MLRMLRDADDNLFDIGTYEDLDLVVLTMPVAGRPDDFIEAVAFGRPYNDDQFWWCVPIPMYRIMTPFEPEMREFLEPSRVFHYAPVPAQALWNLKWYAKVDARYVRRLTDYGFDFKLYKEEAQFLSSCHCAVVNIGRSFYDMTKWRFNLVHPQSEADYRAAKLKLSNASVSLHVRYLTAESVTQTQTYALKFLWEMYEENVERLAYLFGGWSPVDSGDPVSDELAVAESAKTELTEFEDTDLRALPFKATRLTVVRAYLDAVYAVKPLPFSAEIPVKTEYALTDD